MVHKFINLKVKTEYSLCRSAIHYKDLIKEAKKRKEPALGICDDGNLFGGLEFSDECVKAGIQPIIGVSLEFVFESQFKGELNLFAQNEIGYKNILWLSSMAKLESKWQGTIPLTELLERNEGILLLSGGVRGLLGACIKNNDKPTEDLTNIFLAYFGDRFYIEITRHGTQAENELEPKLIELAAKKDLPLIATQDIYFLERDYWEAAEVLLCIGQGRYLVETDRERYSPECFFKKSDEICEIFSDLPEALENSVGFARRINFWAKGRSPMLPTFKTEDGLSEVEELEKQSRIGLKERIESHGVCTGYTEDDYLKRLDFELKVIANMGFAGYFLIVSDFIKWSKKNGVAVGPGRGSGAGSIIAWALYITDLDPIFYGLLFERFLNPDRVSMPDFDIDFCQENRHKTIEYVQKRYGAENVAAIITFGKLQARAVLKDVGRVLQMPYSQVDKISKMVPFNPVDPVTLAKAVELDPELQRQQNTDPDIQRLIDIGLKLEGLNRHSSMHAAGIIIADKPLIELVPLNKDAEGDMAIVGYNMKAAEKAGLVKFDFLGLKTLTIIANACKLIKRHFNIDLDISVIDMKDSKTFELLRNGFTRGIFQLDSVVCKDAMRQMNISDIREIIALTSLNRPGPMENIPSYINRKIGKEAVEYPHESLKTALEETYGIIIYQEQVMQVAQILAGYTLGQADLLRRAMGKKIKEEMEAQRKVFTEGAVKNNINEKQAGEIFDLVEKFAGYGFNKSHAAAYSVISYQTAYLKAHYPIEFFTACLNMAINDTNDLNLFISEARLMGIEIVLPDINHSNALFSVKDNKIYYSLGALKSVGLGSMEEMVRIRNEKGAFDSIFDFCAKVGSKIANKRAVESLAKSGAFDTIHPNRKQIVENIEKLTSFASISQAESQVQEDSLFGDTVKVKIDTPKLDKYEDYTGMEKFLMEFDAIGFYLSGHPLSSFEQDLNTRGIISSDKLDQITAEKDVRIKMAGVVSIVRQRSGKRGRFAFVHLSDLGGIYETCIFNDKLITDKRDLIKEGKVVYIETSVQKQENGAPRIIINEIQDLVETIKTPPAVSDSKKFFSPAKITNNSPAPSAPSKLPTHTNSDANNMIDSGLLRIKVGKLNNLDQFSNSLKKYKQDSGFQVILEFSGRKLYLKNLYFRLTKSELESILSYIN